MGRLDYLNEFLNLELKGTRLKNGNAYGYSFLGQPSYEEWMAEVALFGKRYLTDHPFYSDFEKACSCGQQGVNSLLTIMHAIGQDREFWTAPEQKPTSPVYQAMMGYTNSQPVSAPIYQAQPSIQPQSAPSVGTPVPAPEKKKVFIVHGHDDAAKQEMARTLEKAGFEAIILHEQADGGLTIIEKIEKNTDVCFAVVLYTECDYGRAKEDDISKERFRARQNVVFEHGYLMCKLGRDHVCALVKGNVETPGDISGVVYTLMDAAGAWKMQLSKNMKAAGLEFDFSLFI